MTMCGGLNNNLPTTLRSKLNSAPSNGFCVISKEVGPVLDYERIFNHLSVVFLCWLVVWGLHKISFLVFSQQEEPRVLVHILTSLVLGLFFAVPTWIFHGTIQERYGDEVVEAVEFVPATKQRNTIAVEIFILFFVPSLIGGLRGR
jgi:hypothetical protein